MTDNADIVVDEGINILDLFRWFFEWTHGVEVYSYYCWAKSSTWVIWFWRHMNIDEVEYIFKYVPFMRPKCKECRFYSTWSLFAICPTTPISLHFVAMLWIDHDFPETSFPLLRSFVIRCLGCYDTTDQGCKKYPTIILVGNMLLVERGVEFLVQTTLTILE